MRDLYSFPTRRSSDLETRTRDVSRPLTSDVAEQIVGRERRGRLSQLAWCGEGCFDSRRRVNSTVMPLTRHLRFNFWRTDVSPISTLKWRLLMKTSKLYLLLLAMLAAASILCWNVYSAEKKPNTVLWEYKLVSSIGDNTGQLSQLGTDGWELSSASTEEQIIGNLRETKV